jgi:hypothetical protein
MNMAMYGDLDWDYETPVEEIPGYVGLIFDGFLELSEGLLPLKGFDFDLYGIMADELDELTRHLEIDFGSGITLVSFEARAVNEIVSSIPSVDAIYDCPPNQGPGSGSGYIFLMADGFTIEETTKAAAILRTAIDADFAALEAQYATT